VTVVAVEDGGRTEVVCSRGVRIVADVNVKEVAGRGVHSSTVCASTKLCYLPLSCVISRYHGVALQVAFERQTLKPVFHLIGYRLWV
jgi:hypothetical protein